MAEMRDEMKKLSLKWDKVTTASVQSTQSRSPTPERSRRDGYDKGGYQRRQERRVTFRDDRQASIQSASGGRNAFRRGQGRGNRRGRQNVMYGQQYGPQYNGQTAAYDMQYDGNTMTYTGPTTYFNRGQNLAQQAGGRQNEQCWKCGRRRHERLNLCPAINQQCFICNRIGHFAKVCRSAARANQATSD